MFLSFSYTNKRVRLSGSNAHGKIWGRLVWRGRPRLKDEQIGATMKKQWKLVGVPDYRNFTGKTEEIQELIPKNSERLC